MLKKIQQVFRDKELRNKVLYVAFMLLAYRLMAHIPIPIVDEARLRMFFQSNDMLNMMSILSGSGMSNFSLAMLGVGPYITASIIMQLLTMISPPIKEMYQESGEEGRRKFNQITRLLTVPLALLQSFGMITLLRSQNIVLPTVDQLDIVTVMLITTTATIILMWIGELISEKKIGNGISLIIFAGIVAQIPAVAAQMQGSNLPWITIASLLLVSLLVVLGVVFVTEAQRNIPVSYARRTSAGRVTERSVASFLPLRVNSAGMIPIIFAMSLMLFPGIIASFLVHNSNPQLVNLAHHIQDLLANQSLYAVLYFILVFLFTYFYTEIVFDAKSVAENMQKHGGFIPGIRPGRHTAEYLGKVLGRITFVGAVFLALIAILPILGEMVTKVSSFSIGGASVLIVVGVVLDTLRQIDSQLTMRDYDQI